MFFSMHINPIFIICLCQNVLYQVYFNECIRHHNLKYSNILVTSILIELGIILSKAIMSFLYIFIQNKAYYIPLI